MVRKEPLFKMVRMFAIIVILSWQPTKVFADISGLELKNLLSQKDQISNTVRYKISFVVATQDNPFNDPNQGMVLMDCAATRADQAFAMKMTYHYELPPVFAPSGSKGYKSYDYYDGKLIVWRTLERYILSAPGRNDTIEKIRMFVIDPNGQIVETGDNTKLHRWPIDKPYSMYQFKYYQLPTGRGFSRHLGNVTSVKSLTSGLIKATSQGSFGPSLQGTWEFTVDPNSDNLVRKAIFTTEGSHEPKIVITSAGVIMKDGIKIARRGTFKRRGFNEVSIEVTDISKVVGPNHLYEEVFLYLNSPLPSGTVIVDSRGEKTIRTTVK